MKITFEINSADDADDTMMIVSRDSSHDDDCHTAITFLGDDDEVREYVLTYSAVVELRAALRVALKHA